MGLGGLVGARGLNVVANPGRIDQPGRYMGRAGDERERDGRVGAFDLVDRSEHACAFLLGVAAAGVFEDLGGGAGSGRRSVAFTMVSGSGVVPCAARDLRSTAEASSTR